MNKNYQIIGDHVKNNDEAWFNLNLIQAIRNNGLVQLKYNQVAQHMGHTEYSVYCRGHVYDYDGNLLACPFDKFFNYGERGLVPTTSVMKRIYEKLDGSLIICFFHNDEWVYGTSRTVPNPDNFERRTSLELYFKRDILNVYNLDPRYTYLFEWVGKKNQHVISYDFDSRFYYLGRRHNETHKIDYSEKNIHGFFFLPKIYKFENIETIRSFLDEQTKDFEGFVVLYADNSLWKFKGEEYLKYHKALSHISFARFLKFLKYCRDGKDFFNKKNEYMELLPEEFHPLVEKYMSTLANDVWQYDKLLNEIKYYFVFKFMDNKAKAEYIRKQYPSYSQYLIPGYFGNVFFNPARLWLNKMSTKELNEYEQKYFQFQVLDEENE